MDSPRFDAFTQSVAARLTRRTGLGLLTGASLPLLGLAGDAESKKKAKKITLCVNGKTVKAPKKKAKKLLKQGATKGACAAGCPGGQKACGSGCIPVGDCCVANDCPGDDVCENGDCAPPRCGNGGTCSVFRTSTFVDGFAVGGLAGGDAKCQAAADAADLPGTYKAWLSAGSDTPGTRFENVSQAGPYHLVANTGDGGNLPPLVADSFAGLLTCDGGACLKNAINRDALGVGSADTGFTTWTGTQSDGSASSDTCGGWTSSEAFGLIGVSFDVDARWTATSIFSCVASGVFYCFQQVT